MNDDAAKLEEIRRGAAAVSLLAERCQDDIVISIRLPDGRVLAPTTAGRDLENFQAARSRLAALLNA